MFGFFFDVFFFDVPPHAGAMTEQICRNLEKLDRAKITLESQDVLLLMAELLLLHLSELGS